MGMTMEFIYGIFGFIGFECLKIYKRAWTGKDFIPKEHLFIYVVSLLGLALFSGFLASVLSSGNLTYSIYVGFSVPSSVKAVLDPKTNKENVNNNLVGSVNHVDDIEIDNKMPQLSFSNWSNMMFGYN